MKRNRKPIAPPPSVPAVTPPAAPCPAPTPRPAAHRIRNNYFPWRRLFIVLVGILLELFVWRWAVNHLYALPPHAVGVFGSITNNLMYVVAFLVAYFVTGQAYFTNWTNATTTTIAAEVKSYFETKKSDEKEKAAAKTDK